VAKILRFKRHRASQAEATAPAAPPKVVVRPDKPLIVRSDARPSKSFPSDAVPADGSPRQGAPDPAQDRRRRLFRHGIVLVLGVLVVIVTGAAVFGERGYLAVRRSDQELARLASDVEETRVRVRDLNTEVTRLQTDPHAIERIAREQLGFAGKGEVTFLLSGQEDEDGGDIAVVPAPKGEKKPEPAKPAEPESP